MIEPTSTGLVQFDLSSEFKALGHDCGYSIEDPPKQFYVRPRRGQFDLRIFVIAETYGYHFNDKIRLASPAGRKNEDIFDIWLVLDFQPDRPAGRWKNTRSLPTLQDYVKAESRPVRLPIFNTQQ